MGKGNRVRTESFYKCIRFFDFFSLSFMKPYGDLALEQDTEHKRTKRSSHPSNFGGIQPGPDGA